MSDADDIDTAVAAVDTEFPALFQLFGGYFHEDWQSEHASPAAALSAFVEEAPADAVRAAVRELDRLLQLPIGEEGVQRMLEDGFDCNYVPEGDGMSASEWLGVVRQRLERH